MRYIIEYTTENIFPPHTPGEEDVVIKNILDIADDRYSVISKEVCDGRIFVECEIKNEWGYLVSLSSLASNKRIVSIENETEKRIFLTPAFLVALPTSVYDIPREIHRSLLDVNPYHNVSNNSRLMYASAESLGSVLEIFQDTGLYDGVHRFEKAEDIASSPVNKLTRKIQVTPTYVNQIDVDYSLHCFAEKDSPNSALLFWNPDEKAVFVLSTTGLIGLTYAEAYNNFCELNFERLKKSSKMISPHFLVAENFSIHSGGNHSDDSYGEDYSAVVRRATREDLAHFGWDDTDKLYNELKQGYGLSEESLATLVAVFDESPLKFARG